MFRNHNNDVIANVKDGVITFLYRYGYDRVRFSCDAEAFDHLYNDGWEKADEFMTPDHNC